MKTAFFYKSIAFALVFIIYFTEVNAQEETPILKPKVPFKDRFFTGGTIGLQFGTVTYLDVSPKLGYRVTKDFSAGIGATYIYINDKRYKGHENKSNIYGGRVFGEYRIWENLLAYSEYEILNLEVQDDFFPYLPTRKNISSLLAGGGYSQAIGGNSSAVILVLWNLLDSKYSIYQNPIIRIGFNIGL